MAPHDIELPNALQPAAHRRIWRASVVAAGLLVVAVAATATTFAVRHTTTPTGHERDRVPVATTNPHTLSEYAQEHGALRTAGPYAGGRGEQAALLLKGDRISLARFTDGGWIDDGPAISIPAGSTPITGLRRGPLTGANPSFIVSWVGGDVSDENTVLAYVNGKWTIARFGPCQAEACAAGHLVYEIKTTDSAIISNVRVCRPDCADGSQYLVTWTWDADLNEFMATAQTRMA